MFVSFFLSKRKNNKGISMFLNSCKMKIFAIGLVSKKKEKKRKNLKYKKIQEEIQEDKSKIFP